MNGGEMMVVLIVAIVVIAKVFRSGRFGSRFHDSDHDPTPRLADHPENERLREEIRQLKARVATLERIATDSSASLDREIESLRDRP
jgi:hypothetical protein